MDSTYNILYFLQDPMILVNMNKRLSRDFKKKYLSGTKQRRLKQKRRNAC